ncbi:hypothetical protein NDN08_006899 [Rhodosorus marinus]|uniref:Pre-mRNA-splicing factor SLU7 n=1 Tax=Rhodosorus marinus TaxID=101924 RepID=A0AAV8UIZ6_9RHOD|nr:hypothetical protein NDN08_006899 [Rhodosorus marinus]
MASSTHTFRSRDEYKKAKELEEARKSGQIAPEVDEEGNDINPHIPQYISRAPWYLNQHAPSLKHQKSQLEKAREKYDKLGAWYARGQSGTTSTKYRKGACQKDCMERPRQRGAKFTNKDIKADEIVRDVNLDYEGKRDRWNGYDAAEYKKVIDKSNRLEDERKKQRAQELEDKMAAGKGGKEDSGSEPDDEAEFKLKNEAEVLLEQKDEGTPASVRNLRIRESTAKYLLNLDVNSAYYDPKSRSMREDPTPQIDPEDKDYAGDNFVRLSGDVRNLAELELHAIKAAEENRQLPHMQSDPSLTEMLHKNFKSRKENQESKLRQDVLSRYGGEEFKRVNPEVLLEQSEVYVEYNHDGKVIKGPKAANPRSRYPEDVLEGNHPAIWGSYYDKKERKWGYGCCLQTTRNAYCTGEEGKAAKLASEAEMMKRSMELKKEREKRARELEAREKEPEKNEQELQKESEKKVKQFMKQQDKKDREFQPDERKRGYNSLSGGNVDVTEEEMEAYRRRRIRSDDPMAEFISEN